MNDDAKLSTRLEQIQATPQTHTQHIYLKAGPASQVRTVSRKTSKAQTTQYKEKFSYDSFIMCDADLYGLESLRRAAVSLPHCLHCTVDQNRGKLFLFLGPGRESR